MENFQGASVEKETEEKSLEMPRNMKEALYLMMKRRGYDMPGEAAG